MIKIAVTDWEFIHYSYSGYSERKAMTGSFLDAIFARISPAIIVNEYTNEDKNNSIVNR